MSCGNVQGLFKLFVYFGVDPEIVNLACHETLDQVLEVSNLLLLAMVRRVYRYQTVHFVIFRPKHYALLLNV